MPDEQTHLLSTTEAAERLGVSRFAVYRLIDRGALYAVRVGHRNYIPEWSVTAFVAPPTEPPERPDDDAGGDAAG